MTMTPQGKSYKEIAAEMGIAIGTVAAMKWEALAKLRKAV
jgi:DNA-directed RNA polymerase specialized sigma24 family protein